MCGCHGNGRPRKLRIAGENAVRNRTLDGAANFFSEKRAFVSAAIKFYLPDEGTKLKRSENVSGK